MEVEIRMPDLSTTSSEVTLSSWLVSVGETVALGQPLVEIETDKATMEVESVAKGVLRVIHARPGERVAVGQVIAVIETETAQAASVSNKAAPVQIVPPAAAVAEQAIAPHREHPETGKRTSLFARNAAARRPEALRLSAVQREVARHTQESKQTIPHFYLTSSASAERIAALRAAASRKIAWDAFFVLAAARALQSFDRMQLRLEGDQFARNPDSIGVAVDVDGDLLVVPVEQPLLRTAEQISDVISSHVERMRQGDPDARRLGHSWMTITNLGAENIEIFQAVINPPEAAILAIGRIAPAVVATRDNQIAIQKRVALSLSVDHRVVNGKYAAQFLSRLVDELENL